MQNNVMVRLLYTFLAASASAVAQTVGGGVSSPFGRAAQAASKEAEGMGRYIIILGVILTAAMILFGSHDSGKHIGRTIFASALILGVTGYLSWVSGF
jgi:type IV secretory pathway VirB2 component (pilin)